MQVVTDPLGEADHPLATGNSGDEIFNEVGGCFGHFAGIARGTNTSTFTGEGDKKIVVAAFTVSAGKAVCQDTAFQIVLKGFCDIR